MTKQLTEYTRLNAETVQELRTGDQIIFIGHENGYKVPGTELGAVHTITSDFGDKKDIMSALTGGYADFIDNDGDECALDERNCVGFAKYEGGSDNA